MTVQEITAGITWAELAVADASTWRTEVLDRIDARPGFWECAPVRRGEVHVPVRFVCIPSAAVARIVGSARAFAEHLTDPSGAAAFSSLRGDARLVAPGASGAYPHLQSFLAAGPAAQVDEVFALVGAELQSWWARTEAPVWLSTHGLGVPWLHVRLDSRPKYYAHRLSRDA